MTSIPEFVLVAAVFFLSFPPLLLRKCYIALLLLVIPSVSRDLLFPGGLKFACAVFWLVVRLRLTPETQSSFSPPLTFQHSYIFSRVREPFWYLSIFLQMLSLFPGFFLRGCVHKATCVPKTTQKKKRRRKLWNTPESLDRTSPFFWQRQNILVRWLLSSRRSWLVLYIFFSVRKYSVRSRKLYVQVSR